MKVRMSEDSKIFHAKELKEKLDNGGRLLISITHTSRSNLSYRFKVWVTWNNSLGQVQTDNLGFWLATITGQTLTDSHELKAGGLGFDRYLDVVLAIGHIFENYGLAVPEDRYGYGIPYTPIN